MISKPSLDIFIDLEKIINEQRVDRLEVANQGVIPPTSSYKNQSFLVN